MLMYFYLNKFDLKISFTFFFPVLLLPYISVCTMSILVQDSVIYLLCCGRCLLGVLSAISDLPQCTHVPMTVL